MYGKDGLKHLILFMVAKNKNIAESGDTDIWKEIGLKITSLYDENDVERFDECLIGVLWNRPHSYAELVALLSGCGDQFDITYNDFM